MDHQRLVRVLRRIHRRLQRVAAAESAHVALELRKPLDDLAALLAELDDSEVHT